MNNYITKPYREVLSTKASNTLDKILANKTIQEAFKEGGWIAGGFCRAALLENDLEEYFFGPAENLETRPPAGDIDLFFKSQEKAVKMSELGEEKSGFWKLKSEFAYNSYFVPFKRRSYVQIQFINDERFCYKDGIIACLEAFDITNCKAAIQNKNITFHKEILELEQKKELKIVKNSSPFLGHRIYKYLMFRNLEKIHPDGFPILDDWVRKAAFENFDGYNRKNLQAIKSVKKLASEGLLNFYDIVFFLNKWTENIKILTTDKQYGNTSKAVDWATHYIQKNSKNIKVSERRRSHI